MQTDYQLRHQLFGKLGSLWSRQADQVTRGRARKISEAAGAAASLRRLEVTAGGELEAGTIAVEDARFRFVDGDFAYVGRSQTDYEHATAEGVDGATVSLALRDSAGAAMVAFPTPNELAHLTEDFLQLVAGAEVDLAAGSDWYLIPVPEGLTPSIIEARDGSYLVAGVDFSAHRGYIATRENPAEVFTPGVIRVVSGTRTVEAPHSYVLSAPNDRKCGKYLAEYTRKTQSLPAFRRAAAEFCGMQVFGAADLVLAAHPVTDGTIYVTAALGAVRVDYPHYPMSAGQELQPGHVVAARLALYSEATFDRPLEEAAQETGYDISLDGVLPVKGLSWTPGEKVLADYEEVSPGGTPHLRLHFNGVFAARQAFWDAQKRHELATGVYLYDEVGNGALTQLVDINALLQSYYGKQLVLMVADMQIPVMYSKLMEFSAEYKPAGVALLTSVSGDAVSEIPPNAVLDEFGGPVLDEYGGYILSE